MNDKTEGSNTDYTAPNDEEFKIHEPPKQDPDWKCFMFGATPGDYAGFVYTPFEGQVPNWFVRYMMRIILGCTWVKNKP